MSQPGPPPGPSYPEPEDPEDTDDRPGAPRGRRLLVTLLVVVLVLAAAGAGFAAWQASRDDEPAADSGRDSSSQPRENGGDQGSSGDADLATFYDQQIDWQDCNGNDCGKLRVPLDYEDPDGEEIEIAVLRVPAQDEDNRIGAIVVNPGGPGGSGVQYASAGALQFGNDLTQRYDIVGFDPRGVGKSTALECLDTEELDEVVSFDPDPDDQAERRQFDQLMSDFGQGCLDESGELARHVSTIEAAKDMDVLRAALGQEKLDYLGASYGTFLGATYADLFPENVGKFVLDGAIDPSLSNEEMSLQQAEGFETALRAYVQDCVDGGDCFLGTSVEEGTRKIRAFFDRLEQAPLPTGVEDRPLTAGLGMIGTWLPLYVKSFWPQLTSALDNAMNNGDGGALLGLADLYLSRGDDGYTDNSMQVLYAVNCLDHNDYIKTDQVPSKFAKFEKASPTYGRSFAFSLSTCSNWPIKTGNKTEALDAAGAPPILVIGTTRDPATPLRWAEAMAEQLESGILVRRDGDGHTGFNQGNSCVDSTVVDYFVEDKVPDGDVSC